MLSQFYYLSPVEVVKVTSANLEEAAEWCDGKVATTESKWRPGQLDSYVWVPTPRGTSISWAFPGMFITKRLVRTVKDETKITYAVFKKDYFDRNYFEDAENAVQETWVRQKLAQEALEALREHLAATQPVNVVVNQYFDKPDSVTPEIAAEMKSQMADVLGNLPGSSR